MQDLKLQPVVCVNRFCPKSDVLQANSIVQGNKAPNYKTGLENSSLNMQLPQLLFSLSSRAE